MPLSPQALRALARFPITDLGNAMGRNPTAREAYLKDFLKPVDVRIASYAVFRAAVPMIYGVTLPLDPSPALPWPAICAPLRAAAKADADRCEKVGKLLFDLVRPMALPVYPAQVQPLKTGPSRVVRIDISFYAVEGDRAAFHFVNPRADALLPDARRALGSIVHYAYAQGDFEGASVSLVELGVPGRKQARAARLIPIEAHEIMGKDELQAEIEEVYAMLEAIASDGP